MEFKVGQYCEVKRKITEANTSQFAEVSGDFNPVHLDEEYARSSVFGERIAHGMLSASYISSVIGTLFPGNGTIYMGQNLKFVRPVYIGEELLIRVELIELQERRRARLSTIVKNEKDETVIEGEALVKLP